MGRKFAPILNRLPVVYVGGCFPAQLSYGQIGCLKDR
jgi:hypothetical protein